MEIDDRPDLYLQSEANLQPDECGQLWRLPIPPRLAYSAGTGPLKDAEINFDSYSKRCFILLKNWKAGESDKMIPNELTPTTPYSFALLHRLSLLSRQSKNLRFHCHELLSAYVQKRQDMISKLDSPWFISTLTDDYAEQQIHERIDGVTLADVQAAEEAVQTGAGRSSRSDKAELSKARSEQAQHDAAVRVADKRKLAREHSFKLQKDIQDQRTGKVDLVNIDWSTEDAALGKILSKKQLNKQVREQTAKTRLIARAKALNEGNTTRIARKNVSKRATTLSEIASVLKDEEYAWLDSDSEDEDGDVPETRQSLLDPDNLEPGRRVNSRNWRKGKIPENLRSYVGAVMTRTDEEYRNRDKTTKKADHEKWLKSVLDSSVRLPSEKFDFGTLGKLQPATEQSQVNNMGAALDQMMNEG